MEKALGFEESRIAVRLAYLLESYIDQNDLGIVAGADGMMEIEIDLVRIPDVSVVLWASLPSGGPPEDPIPAIAPDLAVEVLSTSNTRAEIRRKLREYFGAGCKLAWVIEPKDRSTEVYRSPETFVRLTESDSLSGEDVLPGSSASLKDLFDIATRRKPRSAA